MATVPGVPGRGAIARAGELRKLQVQVPYLSTTSSSTAGILSVPGGILTSFHTLLIHAGSTPYISINDQVIFSYSSEQYEAF